jgi:hypothetical protein
VYHLFKADDRRDRDDLFDSLYSAAAVHDQISFPKEDQAKRTAGVTNVDRFKICVKYQNWRIHGASTLA